jgi:CubicO group peptidase (beta-lactamase class C family)
MKLDELNTEWRAINEAGATKEQREQLISATRQRVNQLFGQIFRRDVTETIAALFVAIFFGCHVFAPNLVVRLSAVWLVGWALTVAYKLHRTRTIRKPASLDAPVREFCRTESDRLLRQIQLQRNVLWWYLAPFIVGINAFFIGLAGFGIASALFCPVTLLLAWGIYKANVRAVATELAPRYDELTRLLSQLDDTPAPPSNLTGPVSVEPVAAGKWIVVAARSMALLSLFFCLLVAFGQFISQAVGAFDLGSLSGYFIYCVVTLLLAWDIFRARPAIGEPAGKDADLRAIGAFNLTLRVIVVVFLMALTLPALAFGQFDFGLRIYYVVTALLAWGAYRDRSIARALVFLLLAALVFIPLTGGLFYASYQGTPRSNGAAGPRLAEQIAQLRKENKLVGLAAMVMVDGQVIASAADGERKIRSGVPIELGDRWHLGSITKSITATMIARLIESGQMKWTDTIGERFPDASIHADWKPVTLQQLLTHTSGAPANFPLGVRLKKPALGPECTRERRKAVLDVLAGKPEKPPGETFAYSNVGYTIAGAMAESATGVSWEDLVKREVFEPLELNDAGFGPPKSPSQTLDQPRGHRGTNALKSSAGDDEDNTPIIGPAGTVHMTLANLCKYATEHLRGELGAGKHLTAETYKRLHAPKLHDYACGWVVKQPTDEIPHTVYWHNGSNTMWYALVVFIPGKNMVIAVTANDGDIKAAESAAWKIVNASANLGTK